MYLFKLLLILIFTFALVVISFSDKYKIHKRLMIIGLYFLAVLLILVPSLADALAVRLSVEYGSDLVVYITIAILVVSVSVLYAKTQRQGRLNTKIIREFAIQDVIKT